MKGSVEKTITMPFIGKYPLRTKIKLDNKSIEQMSPLRYIGCDITYAVDCDIDRKLAKYQSVCGIIRRLLSVKTRKDTRLKFYKVMLCQCYSMVLEPGFRRKNI